MNAKSNLHTSKNDDASIELDNVHVYTPGDIVSGTLRLKQKSISLDLIGEFGFELLYPSPFTPAAQSGKSHIHFFKVSTSSMIDGEKFGLRLNEELPPSVNLALDTYPCIQYFLQVNLPKEKQHRHYIIVCPRVSIPRSIVQSQQLDIVNHKEMHLSGSIDRNWILSGETLQITFQIHNPNHKHIKSTNGNIFMKAEFKRAKCTEKVMDFNLEQVVDTNDEHIKEIVSLTISSGYLPPTFTYTNNEHHFHVNITYWILIEMHIRGLFNKISTTIPLSIGYEPEKRHLNQQYNPDGHHAIPYFSGH